MIRINIDFRDGKKFDNLIKYIENNLIYGEAQEKIRILGHHTADNMRSNIETSRKNPARPDHKLENSILAETLNTTGGIEVGIGRIAKMVAEAPYWELINDGGTYVTKATHVVPTTYFADPGSGFVTFKAGSTHTIEGIDFVGRAIRNLDRELTEVMKKLGAEFIGGAKKASQTDRELFNKRNNNIAFTGWGGFTPLK
jgi:hypothetical protein